MDLHPGDVDLLREVAEVLAGKYGNAFLAGRVDELAARLADDALEGATEGGGEAIEQAGV
jgi:hypothetical protein